jgi:flagellar P-ring protein FlgI
MHVANKPEKLELDEDVLNLPIVFTCLLFLIASAQGALPSDATTSTPRQARVKDVASIEGIRDNQLIGYGIVVGLQGTGDSQQTTFPAQTLASTLLRMGVSVPASAIRVQNLAAVFVSATLPPFARPGTKLDITVSSAGDASSLEGGLLLMTPLYGSDGKIYTGARTIGSRGIFDQCEWKRKAIQSPQHCKNTVRSDGRTRRPAGFGR